MRVLQRKMVEKGRKKEGKRTENVEAAGCGNSMKGYTLLDDMNWKSRKECISRPISQATRGSLSLPFSKSEVN